jgi:hypothetical protein
MTTRVERKTVFFRPDEAYGSLIVVYEKGRKLAEMTLARPYPKQGAAKLASIESAFGGIEVHRKFKEWAYYELVPEEGKAVQLVPEGETMKLVTSHGSRYRARRLKGDTEMKRLVIEDDSGKTLVKLSKQFYGQTNCRADFSGEHSLELLMVTLLAFLVFMEPEAADMLSR